MKIQLILARGIGLAIDDKIMNLKGNSCGIDDESDSNGSFVSFNPPVKGIERIELSHIEGGMEEPNLPEIGQSIFLHLASGKSLEMKITKVIVQDEDSGLPESVIFGGKEREIDEIDLFIEAENV